MGYIVRDTNVLFIETLDDIRPCNFILELHIYYMGIVWLYISFFIYIYIKKKIFLKMVER
jgi:hypothetical protein